jgi:hypothetical protein
MDIAFILLGSGFFLLTWVLVYAFEKLRSSS